MIPETLLGVLAIPLGCWALFQYATRRRMQQLAQQAVTRTDNPASPQAPSWLEWFTKWFAGTQFGRKLTADLQQANLPFTALQYIALEAVMGVVAHALVMRLFPFGPWLAASLVVACVQIGSGYYLRGRKERTLQMFEALLPDTVRLMANSLRAGRTLQQTVASIASELPQPVSGIFRKAARQIELRSGVEESLRQLTAVMPSAELKWVELTLVVLHRSGGDLAAALDGIAHTLTERAKARQTIQTIIGHHKRIALGLPLLGAAFMIGLGFMFQGFLTIYFTPVGIGLVLFFVLTQLLVAKVVSLVGRVEV